MESNLAIDEVSKALGSVEATLKAQDRDLAVIKDGIKDITKHLTIMNGSIGKAHARMDTAEPKLEKAYEQGNDWQDTKTKAKWILGLGFLGSAGGGLSIGKFFSGLFG
jgi:hypothetical protein